MILLIHLKQREVLNMKNQTTRVTVNLNSELVNQVDDYARNMNINRTSAVAVLLSQAVNSTKLISELDELLALTKRGDLNGI